MPVVVSTKSTDPDGVPGPPGTTVAVSVTGWPKMGKSLDAANWTDVPRPAPVSTVSEPSERSPVCT